MFSPVFSQGPQVRVYPDFFGNPKILPCPWLEGQLDKPLMPVNTLHDPACLLPLVHCHSDILSKVETMGP